MFSQTAPVLDADNEIVLFHDSNCVGNRALYMLLCSKVDNFYRNLIQREQNMGDKALKLLKSYCASCTIVDKTHFHRELTNLRIITDETATHFLKRFTVARTKAIIADNEYSDDETVDLFLAAVAQSKNVQYLYVIQHYLSERHGGRTVSFHDIERRLLAIDESSERETYNKRRSKIALGLVVNDINAESAHIVSDRKIICYNCRKPGHKAPECKEPRKQQANHVSSTGRRRGENNKGGGRGHGRNKNQRGHGGGGKLQQANVSHDNSQPDTIIHGCSARVVDLSLNSASTYYSVTPSPISLWTDRLPDRYITVSCQESPEEIDSFEPFYITWCLNVADVFNSKMELVNPELQYGDTWEDLDEPLLILSELEPFPAAGMNYTSIVHPGTHRNSYKRTRQMFKEGILPALQAAFEITPVLFPISYKRWHKFVSDYLRFRLCHDDHNYNRPAIIHCDNETLFLCFCPDRAATPSLSISGNGVRIKTRDMEQDYALTHTLFFDYDSPDCWKNPEDFWASVDEGYGEVPIPYAWQPYYSDLDSQLTHVTLSESTQPEPSEEGTVTVDASLSHSSSLASEHHSDDSQNYFFQRQYKDTDPPSYFEVRRAASAVDVQLVHIEDIDDTEYVASCSDSETESMDDIEEFE
jgi:hypothetical protein